MRTLGLKLLAVFIFISSTQVWAFDCAEVSVRQAHAIKNRLSSGDLAALAKICKDTHKREAKRLDGVLAVTTGGNFNWLVTRMINAHENARIFASAAAEKSE